MLKVLKFGGTSMADAAQFQKIKAIVDAEEGRDAIIVSAPGKRFKDDHKVTDLLYLCHAHLQYGVSCDGVFGMVRDRYLTIKHALGLKVNIEAAFDALREKMRRGISQDELASRGEYFAAMLMADYLGFDFVDAKDWLYFNLDGTVDEEKSYSTLASIAKGRRIVTPGFYGLMPDGSIRTFTRGGSDITGALVAAALDADVYENWTDVSGILIADPRIVENPAAIAHVTYAELRELSYAGAQVLHEGTIMPVRVKNIPVNIRNTNDPSHPGTIISERFEDGESPNFITGIAGRKGFTIITVNKAGISSKVGALRRILELFESFGVSVEYLPAGIDSYSFVVSLEKSGADICLIRNELEKKVKPDEIRVTENIAVIAAVGRQMANRLGTSGRIFKALGDNGINIRMISQGPEELNIIVGVDEADFCEAIRVLYNSFVK